MEEIFFSEQDEVTGRFIVIEEENDAIWAYLTFPFKEEIDKHCFLASRKKIRTSIIGFVKSKIFKTPPPMVNKYSTSSSYLPNLLGEEIEVKWMHQNALIKIRTEPFLIFIQDVDKGFCKSISQDGIYGNKWCESTYKGVFK